MILNNLYFTFCLARISWWFAAKYFLLSRTQKMQCLLKSIIYFSFYLSRIKTNANWIIQTIRVRLELHKSNAPHNVCINKNSFQNNRYMIQQFLVDTIEYSCYGICSTYLMFQIHSLSSYMDISTMHYIFTGKPCELFKSNFDGKSDETNLRRMLTSLVTGICKTK